VLRPERCVHAASRGGVGVCCRVAWGPQGSEGGCAASGLRVICGSSSCRGARNAPQLRHGTRTEPSVTRRPLALPMACACTSASQA
jgi:hypothetical protein